MNNEPHGSPAFRNKQAWYHFLKGEEMRTIEKVQDAINHLNKAKEINSTLRNQELEASILESLGFCYMENGDYEKAIKFAENAIAITKQLPELARQPRLGNRLVFLGAIYSQLAEYDKAISLQKEGIEILSKSEYEDLLGVAYGNIGETYSRMREYEKAIPLLQEALKISRKRNNKFEEARCLLDIANVYQQMSKFEESLVYCMESERIFKEIGSAKGLSICHGVLGSNYGCLGRTGVSLAYMKSCIESNEHRMQFSELAIAYGNVGLQLYHTALWKFLGRSNDATEFFKRCIESFKLAIGSTNKVLINLSIDSSKTAFSDRFYRWYNAVTSPLILMGRSTAALLFLDLGRAKILRHLVYNQVRNQEDDISKSSFESSRLAIENAKEKERSSTLSKEIQLSDSNATLLFYNFNDADILTIWVLDAIGCVSLKTSDPTAAFSKSREELENLTTKLLEKASVGFPREYSFFKQSTPIHCNAEQLTSVQQNDEENTTSDNYINGKSKSPAKRPVQSCDDSTKGTRALLYNLLIKPVEKLINGKKLIIVPQSCIFFAPFASFVDENGSLLSEKYQIQIIPSIHVLAMTMRSSTGKQTGSSLFVGNPETGNVLLPSLPSAAEEVEYLALLLSAKPVIGRVATKSNLVKLMSNASIIHIAAHGDSETGHIYLAPESNQSNDSAQHVSSAHLLTQSDVLECKLIARLVVLSCCHSGMGKLSSEGVIGIARSFLGAGASAVLVTLWSINDVFTKEFMKVFYSKICEEKSACLSLKETMNHFQSSGPYTSFLFWAAFEILGEDIRFTKSEIEQIRRKNKDVVASK